jgi:hypothetical protein
VAETVSVLEGVAPIAVLPFSTHGVELDNMIPYVPPTFTAAVGDIEQPSAKFGHFTRLASTASNSAFVTGVPVAHAAASARILGMFGIYISTGKYAAPECPIGLHPIG